MAPGSNPKHEVSAAVGWKPILAKLNRDVSHRVQMKIRINSTWPKRTDVGWFRELNGCAALAESRRAVGTRHQRIIYIHAVEKIIVGLASSINAHPRENHQLGVWLDLFTCTFHSSFMIHIPSPPPPLTESKILIQNHLNLFSWISRSDLVSDHVCAPPNDVCFLSH